MLIASKLFIFVWLTNEDNEFEIHLASGVLGDAFDM